jgi:acetyl-CoA C-acetyltransferase
MSYSAVIGYSSTKFGELWNKSLSDLIKESAEMVLDYTKITLENVDAIFFSNMLAGVLENNLHLAAKIADILHTNIPIFRVESACCSGGMAFHLAQNYLQANPNSTVMVLGAEKMTDYGVEAVTSALAAAASGDEQEAGLTFPGLYGMIAERYLKQFNYTEENLAHIAVKNHFHGKLNDKGHFQNLISVQDVINSGYVAKPLKVLDCSPISDGAAGIILTNKSSLIQQRPNNIEVIATEVASDTISLKNRDSLVSLKSTKIAAQKAFDKTGLLPKDIGVVELHDCFTIAEIIALEDLGFWKPGKGGEMAEKEITRIDKNSGLVVNPSGGLKASGHPVGATGVKQIGEIYLQLTGQAGQRQVENLDYGLTHNVGGSGGTAVVNIFKAK